MRDSGAEEEHDVSYVLKRTILAVVLRTDCTGRGGSKRSGEQWSDLDVFLRQISERPDTISERESNDFTVGPEHLGGHITTA